MNITVSNNSIYDVPRSGINISEGTWGGHIIEFNDVFNTVLETSDHGAFNSWGRDRFWHPNRATLDKITTDNPEMPYWDAIHTTVIRNNRFRCDHGWDIDLDDGSSNYHLYNNLCLGCSFKLREGFFRVVENNICIGRFPPGKHVCYRDNHDVVRRNIYVNTSARNVYKGISCLTGEVDQWDYNLYWSLIGDAQFSLSGSGNSGDYSLEEWQAIGLDRHSLVTEPGFVAPEELDFNLRPDSPAFKLGFQPFDVSRAGVKKESFIEEWQAAYTELNYYAPQEVKASARSQAITEMHDMKVKNLVGMQEMSAAAVGEERGVLVLEVSEGGRAARAGIKPHDLILAWNEDKIYTVDDLAARLEDPDCKKATLSVDGNKPPRQVEIDLR